MASVPRYAAQPVPVPGPSPVLVEHLNTHLAAQVRALALDAARMSFNGAAVKGIVQRVATRTATLDDFLAFQAFLKKASAFAAKIIANAPLKLEALGGGRTGAKLAAMDCLIPNEKPLCLRTRVQWARANKTNADATAWPLSVDESKTLDDRFAAGDFDVAPKDATKAKAEAKALAAQLAAIKAVFCRLHPEADLDQLLAKTSTASPKSLVTSGPSGSEDDSEDESLSSEEEEEASDSQEDDSPRPTAGAKRSLAAAFDSAAPKCPGAPLKKARPAAMA